MIWLLLPVALAHLQVTSHTARTGRFELKEGPCGQFDAEWGDGEVYAFAPGETLTVTWDEYINHPGHYRVAFDPDGDDDFVDPASFTDTYTNDAVLMDDLADKNGGDYSIEVTLPDVSCERCVLQVIQVMTDKPPYGDGNDLYYQCIDFTMGDGGAGPTDDPDRGCEHAPGSWLFTPLVAVLFRRRRTR